MTSYRLYPLRLILLLSILFSFVCLATPATYTALLLDAASDADAAIKEADKAIEAAKQNATKINECRTKIAEANKGPKAEAETGKIFSELTKFLKDVLEKALKDQKDGIATLTTNKAALEKMRKGLEALEKKPEGTDVIIANLKKKEGELDTQLKSSTETSTALETEAKKFYTNIDAIAKALSTSMVPLSDEKLPGAAKGDDLLATLPAQLPVLANSIPVTKDLDANWPPLGAELTKITAPTSDPKKAFDGAKKDIGAPQNKLLKWLETLFTQAEATNKALLDKRAEMDKDLPANAVIGMKLLDAAEQEEQRLIDLRSGWTVLVPQIKTDANFANLKTNFDKIEAALKIRPDRTQLIRESLAGDFTKFEPDFVQLYYFTDTQNLMRALNPNVKELKDGSALREEATKQRRLLDEASLAQVSAQADVNALQTRVRDLEDELRQAQSNAFASADLLLRSTRRLEELKSRPDQDAGKIKIAEQRKTDAETTDKANQDTLAKLNDEKAGLPAQIAEARKALLTAQKQVRDRRIAMVSLAQIESDAFAKARDNEQVFYTEINVTSKDPVKRILIYAFGSRRVLFLRGEPENLEKAKDIIALFDRPAPQARLNLWTLELNSTADKEGAKKFNKALTRVENELSRTRSKIAAALSYLRDCINEEVNAIALNKLRELERARLTNRFGPANQQVYAVPQDAEDLRWARLYFYQKEVLMRLGFDPELVTLESRRQSTVVSFRALPDPAGTTTLGEALIILSLANPASRYEILKKYSEGVGDKLSELNLDVDINDGLCRNSQQQTWFASTKRAMGSDSAPYYQFPLITDQDLRRGRPAAPNYFPPDYVYTSMQKEIVDAITLAQVPWVVRRLRQLQNRLDSTRDQNERDAIQREAGTILRWLHFSLGVNIDQVLKPGLVEEIENLARKKNILRTASAKVARTDLMLRQIINAVDEDLNRHFVQPMVDCLRERLVRDAGIGVGIVNRTSVLATNRLVARVDARSSAQLTVGEEQDVLAGVQQLANLFLASQTGGLFGGIAALKGVPQKETSEIYGINNGSLFKVTPIFDPTGQALRFQFDYVLANVVQNPDGSINPQLPRIERHTVNTEVELNNLELREISRFESNSRLGIPTTRKGGIPIIKDIPGMKYVPLLGWFVKRSGSSAVIQQSLMFGQTSMYPTIADIFDLLSGEDYKLGKTTCPCPEDSGSSSQLPAEPQNPPTNPPVVSDPQKPPATPPVIDKQLQDLKKRYEELEKKRDALEAQLKTSKDEKKTRDDEIERLNRELAIIKAEIEKNGGKLPELREPTNLGLTPEPKPNSEVEETNQPAKPKPKKKPTKK